MTNEQSLELFILDGEQAGARAPLQCGQSIDISGDLGTDIVLRDPGMAGQHIRLNIGADSATLDVLTGEVGLLGQRITAGNSTELPPYVALNIGAIHLAYGEQNSARWAEMPQFNVDSVSDKTEPLDMHETYSAAHQQSGPPPSGVTKKSMVLWSSAAAVLVFSLMLGMGAFSSISEPETVLQAKDITVALEGIADFRALDVVEPEPGTFVIRGYLASREQRERLVQLLAGSANLTQVQLQILVGEQLVVAVRDIYRVNGIAANVQSQGFGIVSVTTTEADLEQLRRVETIAKRDIIGLLGVVADNELPPVSAKPTDIDSDPGKRIASIVPGDPAYLVTTDGARYFVGAMLPTGHKISAISAQQVLLDKGGVMTTLHF